MHVYDCRLDTFIYYATTGQIADILTKRFVERLEQNPSDSEVTSWRNSLGAFAESVTARDMDEAWIVLEYQLPLASSRIDCMVLGTDAKARANSVLIELKQWDRCMASRIPEVVEVGGQSMLHPSAQVRNYRRYLEDAHSAFADDGVRLASCAFLHNLKQSKASDLAYPQYAELLDDSPLFGADSVDELASFVSEPTQHGAPDVLVQSILEGRYKPSRKLLDHVADSVEGYEPWKRDDQYEVKVFSRIRDMEAALRSRVADGDSARMVAGFVWPWSDPGEDGTLVHDVTIDDWARPWNRKPREMWRRRKGSAENPSTHPYKLWATEPSGFDEVGCIYSAQGFEFDYVGVIFCDDLRWDPMTSKWVADLPRNVDVGFKRGLGKNPQMAAERLKHIYRVLSTRGMKGTYFYFLDEATARHFERLGADAET